MKHLLLPGLLCAVFLVSCKQTSETTLNGSSIGMWAIPNTGTTYVFENTPSTGFDTDVIVKTGQSLGGKTNVLTYSDHSSDGEIANHYYSIDPNGDFSIGSNEGAVDSLGNPVFTWQTYPTGSRQPINVEPPFDTIEGDEIEVRTDIISYVDTETLTVAAGTYSTMHIQQVFIDADSIPNDPGDSFSEIESYDLWFAPAIGNYIKTSEVLTENNEAENASVVELIQYIAR